MPCSSAFWALFLVASCTCRVIQFYIEPTQKTYPTFVQQLVEGNLQRIEQSSSILVVSSALTISLHTTLEGMRLTASVSLVFDAGYYIVVDSPSATDVQSKELMLKGVSSRNLAPGEVQVVVTTHGHPDHFGQGNFYPNARHFFGSYEYSDKNFITTELHTSDSMQLTKNVQLWNTPGHTAQDVSVMVHNVPCCGIVAVTGDLFYNEEDALQPAGIWYQEAWNPIVGKISRNKVICYADYVIPGHGKLFKISPEMKASSECNSTSSNPPSRPIVPSAAQANSNLVAYSQSMPTSATSQATSITSSTTTVSSMSSMTAAPTLITQQTFFSTNNGASYVPSTTSVPMTTSFYTVDLTAETPSSKVRVMDDGNGIQEKLPPLRKYTTSVPQTGDNKETNSSVAPIVEGAARELAKMLNVGVGAVKDNDPYPYTKFWQDTLKKIVSRTNEVIRRRTEGQT